MRSLLITFLILFSVSPTFGLEVEGVHFPKEITVANTTLHLNGVGVRSKFIFDIYVAGLYLETPSHDGATVIASDSHKQIQMHFLYKEVSAEKLIKGWKSGFSKNLSKEEQTRVETQIKSFNDLFSTVHDGDIILITYTPGTGTTITIRGENRGIIQGKDFSDALFKIWLGDNPVKTSLKNDLLGI